MLKRKEELEYDFAKSIFCKKQTELCNGKILINHLNHNVSLNFPLKHSYKNVPERPRIHINENQEEKKIDNVLYILGLSSAVICCVYLLISKITGFRIENYLYPCLFHTVTGYYCPGCRGTRAVSPLFQGHFLISFLEHPFVPYAAVLCAWFLLSQTIERLSHHKLPLAMHYKDRYLWIGLAILIINCMVKNIVRLFWGISLL